MSIVVAGFDCCKIKTLIDWVKHVAGQNYSVFYFHDSSCRILKNQGVIKHHETGTG